MKLVMISIEKSITSVYTLVKTTILIYKTFLLIPLLLSPSGVQHTSEYLAF